MTQFVGSHFQQFPETPSTPDLGAAAPSGLGNSRERTALYEFITTASGDGSFDPATNDTLVLGKMQSNWRITELWVVGKAVPVTWTFDLGIFELDGDGVLVAVDAAGFGADLSLGATESEEFNDAAGLVDGDKGKPVWELMNLGAATITEDPKKTYYLVGTFNDAAPVASVAARGLFRFKYVAGD